MNIYKTVTKTVKETHIEAVVCDFCKQPIKWSHGYDVCDIQVSYRHGKSYPTGGMTTTERWDFCESCFIKVMETFRYLGIEHETTEYEW